MPSYEYRCHCGYTHVVTLTFSEKGNYCPFCTECGSKMMQVFSPAGVVFKGSGFYRNDSRPAPPKPAKKKKDNKNETKGTSSGT